MATPDGNVGLVPNVGIVVGSRTTPVIDPGQSSSRPLRMPVSAQSECKFVDVHDLLTQAIVFSHQKAGSMRGRAYWLLAYPS